MQQTSSYPFLLFWDRAVSSDIVARTTSVIFDGTAGPSVACILADARYNFFVRFFILLKSTERNAIKWYKMLCCNELRSWSFMRLARDERTPFKIPASCIIPLLKDGMLWVLSAWRPSDWRSVLPELTVHISTMISLEHTRTHLSSEDQKITYDNYVKTRKP